MKSTKLQQDTPTRKEYNASRSAHPLPKNPPCFIYIFEPDILPNTSNDQDFSYRTHISSSQLKNPQITQGKEYEQIQDHPNFPISSLQVVVQPATHGVSLKRFPTNHRAHLVDENITPMRLKRSSADPTWSRKSPSTGLACC